MPSISSSRSARRHQSLENDILATGPLRAKPRKRNARPEDVADNFVDSRSSRKILKIGQDLANEEREETLIPLPEANAAFTLESRFDAEGAEEDEDARQHGEEWLDNDEAVIEENASYSAITRGLY